MSMALGSTFNPICKIFILLSHIFHQSSSGEDQLRKQLVGNDLIILYTLNEQQTIIFLCSSLLRLRFEKCESSEFFTGGGALPPCPPPCIHLVIHSIKPVQCSYHGLSTFQCLQICMQFKCTQFQLFWIFQFVLILYILIDFIIPINTLFYLIISKYKK